MQIFKHLQVFICITIAHVYIKPFSLLICANRSLITEHGDKFQVSSPCRSIWSNQCKTKSPMDVDGGVRVCTEKKAGDGAD